MLRLDQLLPIPLRDMPAGVNPRSGVFQTNLLLEKGKNYLLTAPSGKGKSTLLHILYGLRHDYEGAVFFEATNLRQLGLDDWAAIRQRRLAIVFQDHRLFPNLSAWENIQLKNALTDFRTEAEIREQAASLGMKAFLGQACGTLSYGQRQRIAILRALCQPFDLLLLDEPFSHLDEENTRLATHLIERTCAAQGAGLVMASLGEPFQFRYDSTLEI